MFIVEKIPQILFFSLEIIIISAALGVVLIPNIVYSAFLLGVVLIGIAGLFILLNADFLAAAQILIYVGAINILILFAIMLVNNRLAIKSESKPLVIQLIGAFLSVGGFAVIGRMIFQTNWPKPPFIAQPNTLPIIGNHIFSDYLLPFEIISVILLIGLIGAILLARKEKKSNLSALSESNLNISMKSKNLSSEEQLNLLDRS